jgi:hypothetical protein
MTIRVEAVLAVGRTSHAGKAGTAIVAMQDLARLRAGFTENTVLLVRAAQHRAPRTSEIRRAVLTV